MGLLDQVIGGVLGQVLGGGRGQPQGGGGMGGGGAGGGMLGGAMSPIVQAVLMLLMQKGMSGGLGDLLGGGSRQAPQNEGGYDAPPRHRDGGDLGGFGQDRDRSGGRRDEGGGEFGDLSGMLDGPGGSSAPAGRDSGMGSYSGQGGHDGETSGGLDDLMDRFQRGGLGDVMESWIGPGQNRAVEPNRLGEALGPQTVDTLASRTGLDRDSLLSQLAQVLPGVIDGLTPQGRRPSPEERRGW